MDKLLLFDCYFYFRRRKPIFEGDLATGFEVRGTSYGKRVPLEWPNGLFLVDGRPTLSNKAKVIFLSHDNKAYAAGVGSKDIDGRLRLRNKEKQRATNPWPQSSWGRPYNTSPPRFQLIGTRTSRASARGGIQNG